ncbi:hypothetical protein AVEN_159554-1, partial [Araneus ventricosus]
MRQAADHHPKHLTNPIQPEPVPEPITNQPTFHRSHAKWPFHPKPTSHTTQTEP